MDNEPQSQTPDDESPDASSRKKAGMDPEDFQRQLIFVTATVLVLGIVGGTCLGMKIKRAENATAAQVEADQQQTPDERARESTASSNNSSDR